MSKLFSGKGFSGNIKNTQNEFLKLRDIIYELSGIYLQDNRRSLVENKFAPRLSELELKSCSEYVDYLQKHPKGKTEEPYTLAIILHEALKDDIRKWRIKITANDISTNV